MTKKSKKKAAKTGYRNADEPRCTTVNVGYSSYPHKRPLILDNENDADNIGTKHVSKAERKRLERMKQEEFQQLYKLENEARAVYPLDLWFLIGQFIEPEQVKLFTMICRGSYHVTCSRKFWLELYDRYVTEHKGLPSHLKPNAICTNIGLRARVVRSLYHVYRPFSNKTLHHIPLAESPRILENLMVEAHWWKRLISTKHIYVWRLYLKLVKINCSEKNSTTNKIFNNSRESIFSVTKLLTHNPEEQYKLLQVTSSSYAHIPNVFGMCLTEVGTSAGRDMKSHKARLYFHEYRAHRTRYHNSQATILTVDPVLDVQIFNWWDTEYPHPFDT